MAVLVKHQTRYKFQYHSTDDSLIVKRLLSYTKFSRVFDSNFSAVCISIGTLSYLAPGVTNFSHSLTTGQYWVRCHGEHPIITLSFLFQVPCIPIRQRTFRKFGALRICERHIKPTVPCDNPHPPSPHHNQLNNYIMANRECIMVPRKLASLSIEFSSSWEMERETNIFAGRF